MIKWVVLTLGMATILGLLFFKDASNVNTPVLIGESNRVNNTETEESKNIHILDTLKSTENENLNITNCENFDNSYWYTDEVVTRNLELIKNEILRYKDERLDENTIDIISFKSGIGVANGRLLQGIHNTSWKAPFFYQGQVELYSTKDLSIIESFIQTGQLQPFMMALSSGELNTNVAYSGNKAMVFLIEKLLEEGVTSAEAYSLILDYDIHVFYSDLVAATKAQLPIEIITKLHTVSGLPASTTLSSYGKKLSLVNYAISTGAFDLAVYWFKEGSPAEPDEFTLNGLDLLAREHKKYTQEEFDILANTLLESGLSPNAIQSSNILKKILPKNISNRFESQLIPLGENGFDQNDLGIAKQYIFELNNKVLSEIDEKEGADNVSNQCTELLGKKVISYTMNHTKGKNKVESKAQKINIENEKVQSDEIKIHLIQNEQEIGEIQNIESKNAIEQLRIHQVSEKAKELRDDENLNRELEDSAKASLNEIISLANSGRWDYALQLLEKSNNLDKPMVYSILLNIALSNDVNFFIIENLFGLGAKLSSTSINVLIISDNAVLAKKLLAHNLNIHYIDPLGYSTIVNSVRMKSINMLNFLIESGVSVMDSTLGYDALDFALKDFSMLTHKDIFIKVLLDAGIVVEDSHRQWVEGMRSKNMDSYLYLISRYPFLISS